MASKYRYNLIALSSLYKNTLKPRCSILIVNWNSWELLSRCLDALANQSYRNFKVFVADNASNDEPHERFFTRFPDIVFVQNDVNYGFAEANNRLLDLAKNSEWVIFLNPDTIPDSDWLEHLMRAASDNPGYSVFSSRLLMADAPDKLDGDGDSYHISGLAWRNRHGQTVDINSIPREVFSPCAAAAMYHTEVLLTAGGFDKEFFCYFEDVDLGFRLRLENYNCLLVPSAIVHHVGSATTGGQQSDFSVYHGHRNLVWTYIKNMPGMLFWLLLPYHILLNIFTIGWFALRGQGRVILRAKWDAMKGIPAMWRKRKLIQSKRTASLMDIWRVMDKRLIPWRCR